MRYETPPTWRRAIAGAIDLAPGLFAAGITASLVATQPYSPPTGWFWTEWLLKLWLDRPVQLLAPIGVAGVTTVLWNLLWEGWHSRTPGCRLTGLEIVDRRGRMIGWSSAAGRAIGTVLNLATLGLGTVWIWVDPEGRGLRDRFGRTWTVRAHPKPNGGDRSFAANTGDDAP